MPVADRAMRNRERRRSTWPAAKLSNLTCFMSQVRPSGRFEAELTRKNFREIGRGNRMTRRSCASPFDRVGGELAPAALPHHRTCGSAYGGSRKRLKAPAEVCQRNQPSGVKVGLREGQIHGASTRVPPGA